MGWQIANTGLMLIILFVIYLAIVKTVKGFHALCWLILFVASALCIPIGLIIQIWQ